MNTALSRPVPVLSRVETMRKTLPKAIQVPGTILFTVRLVAGSPGFIVPVKFTILPKAGLRERFNAAEPAGADTFVVGVKVAPSAAQGDIILISAALILKKTLLRACTLTRPIKVGRLGTTNISDPSFAVLPAKTKG